MSKERAIDVFRWWWLRILMCAAMAPWIIAQIDCPDNLTIVGNCTDSTCASGIQNAITFDLMTDEFICPVLNGMMWFIRIVNGSNTFCGSNDETSIACISDGGLCINSTMLSTDDSPQNLTFYHDNRHVEVIYAKEGVYAVNRTVMVDQDAAGIVLMWFIYDNAGGGSPAFSVSRKLDGQDSFVDVDVGIPDCDIDHDCSRGGSSNIRTRYCYQVTPETDIPGTHMYRLSATRGQSHVGNDTISLQVVGTMSSMAPSTIVSSNTPTSSVATSSVGTTPTTTPTTSTIDATLIAAIVIPVVIVLAVVIVLSFLILTIAVCCYGRRRKRQGARTGGDVPLVPLPQQGYIPPSEPPVPDTAGKYTGLYCTSRYTESGDILKAKHDDLIQLLNDADAINAARIDSNCSDVLIFSDIVDDVVKEVTSSGNPDHRGKVKIVQFVAKDKTPDNTLEIEGYKVVQYEGRPDNLDDLLSVTNKAEYPVAKSYQIDGIEDRSSVSSDHNSHFERTMPLEQTDTPLQSHNSHSQSTDRATEQLLLPVLERINDNLNTLVGQGDNQAKATQEAAKDRQDMKRQGAEGNKLLGEIVAQKDVQEL